jgi:hypothetical protein
MTAFPGSPRLLKCGLVLIDPDTAAVQRVITLQYNPDALSRAFQIRGMAAEGDRLEAMRLNGPPVETYKLDAEIDAVDQLEFPEKNPNAVAYGIQPQLALIETLIYPTSADIRRENNLLSVGTIEVAPAESPLTLLVLGKNRLMPVRLTELSIVEEAFDVLLNPIRAKVSMTFRVLSVNDLSVVHRGTAIYMTYQQEKERMAKLAPSASLDAFGRNSI